MNSYKSRDKQIAKANATAEMKPTRYSNASLVDKANKNKKFTKKEDALFNKRRYETGSISFNHKDNLYSFAKRNSFKEQTELANMRVDKQINRAQRTAGLYSKHTEPSFDNPFSLLNDNGKALFGRKKK